MTSKYVKLDESLKEVEKCTFTSKVEVLVLEKKARIEKKRKEFNAVKKELVQKVIAEYKTNLLKENILEDAVAQILTSEDQYGAIIFRDNLHRFSLFDDTHCPDRITIYRNELFHTPLNIISTAKEDQYETRSLYQILKEKLPLEYDITTYYTTTSSKTDDDFVIVVHKNIIALNSDGWWWLTCWRCVIFWTYSVYPPLKPFDVFTT